MISALLADLYELTMLESYFNEGMDAIAVFDLFIRRLPPNRNYFVACGLEHILQYLETVSFSAEDIDYLRSLNLFTAPFLDSLRGFRFTGDVYAVPEGTVIFANEPLIEVIAPLTQAQLVETFLMNQIQLATLAATKAARIVHAAQGRSVVDFGLRRMHGIDSGIKQPRAFYIAGVDATSSVIAGKTWGIPVTGTMAHSYVLAFENELEAFRRFLKVYPTAILLIDTFDTNQGVENVIQLARELGSQFRVSGVRLDSGDLAVHAREVRRRLDAAGLRQVKIFASSDLDEYEIDRLVRAGIPIDGFGVGRHLAVSSDMPALDTAYKLTEYAGVPKMKLSEKKATLPGRKQIFRQRGRDIIGLMGEQGIAGDPLLIKVMENGGRLAPLPSLTESRAYCKAQLDALPESPYPVELSRGLTKLKETV